MFDTELAKRKKLLFLEICRLLKWNPRFCLYWAVSVAVWDIFSEP